MYCKALLIQKLGNAMFSYFFFQDCDAPFQVNFYTDTSNDGTTSAQRGDYISKILCMNFFPYTQNVSFLCRSLFAIPTNSM